MMTLLHDFKSCNKKKRKKKQLTNQHKQTVWKDVKNNKIKNKLKS